MKIAIIFDGQYEGTLGVYYKRALEQLGTEVSHFWLKGSDKIDPVFDAYLRVDDGDYKYDIPHDKLRPSFFYASDTHLKKPFSAIAKAAHSYDHIFCAQYDGFLRLKQARGEEKVSWLPHAYEPVPGAGAEGPKRFDVAFIGNDGGLPRKLILQELRERYPNSYIGNASNKDIAKIYGVSKIGFNYSIADDINMRIFEVMGSGAMLLTNEIRDAGFDLLFKKGKEVITYASPKEIFSLIDYYLRSAQERESIAAAGKKLAILEHTYKNRASFILKKIDQHISAGAPGAKV